MTSLYKGITSRFGTKYVFHRTVLYNEEIVVRLADHDDYHHILALSKDGDIGTDYLPTVYHRFLDAGNVLMTLILRANTPVAFKIDYFMDNGSSILGMGARTISQFRGQGYFQIMHNYTMMFYMKQIRAFERHFTIGVWKEARDNFHTKHKSLKLLEFNTTKYETSFALLRNIDKIQKPTRKIQQISTEDAERIFSNRENFQVFQSSRFNVSRPAVTYQVNKANILTATESNLVFISQNESSNIDGISFAHKLPVIAGLIFDIFYYGKADFNVYTAHVLKALHSLESGCSDQHKDIRLLLHYPLEIPSQDVVDFIYGNILAKKEYYSNDDLMRVNVMENNLHSVKQTIKF